MATNDRIATRRIGTGAIAGTRATARYVGPFIGAKIPVGKPRLPPRRTAFLIPTAPPQPRAQNVVGARPYLAQPRLPARRTTFGYVATVVVAPAPAYVAPTIGARPTIGRFRLPARTIVPVGIPTTSPATPAYVNPTIGARPQPRRLTNLPIRTQRGMCPPPVVPTQVHGPIVRRAPYCSRPIIQRGIPGAALAVAPAFITPARPIRPVRRMVQLRPTVNVAWSVTPVVVTLVQGSCVLSVATAQIVWDVDTAVALASCQASTVTVAVVAARTDMQAAAAQMTVSMTTAEAWSLMQSTTAQIVWDVDTATATMSGVAAGASFTVAASSVQWDVDAAQGSAIVSGGA